jgi:hypothetical protein
VKWFFSFLSHRRQRVKIGGDFSDWVELVGGMPQGSWLGLLSFLILIDDLNLACLVHKFVDDTTLTELMNQHETQSLMSVYLSQLESWVSNNHMKINSSKTKEMILGAFARSNPSGLSISGKEISRVDNFKLLGIHISNNLTWNTHIDAICAKAATRIYFLKHLKRAGLSPNHLLHFYLSVIRSLLEYGAPVWHHRLTKYQTDKLEAIQKRALKIIYSCTVGMPYPFATAYAGIQTLHTRREHLSEKFFKALCSDDSCLFQLLPPPRDPAVASRLRKPTRFPIVGTRTHRYCSFIYYGLAHYQ